MTILTVTYDDAVHKFVPLEPSKEIISAMASSQARDDEGNFPALLDLLDFSGENATRTVLRKAWSEAIAAAPPFTSLPDPDLEIVGQALQYAAENLDGDDTFIDAYAAFKRLKGDV